MTTPATGDDLHDLVRAVRVLAPQHGFVLDSAALTVEGLVLRLHDLGEGEAVCATCGRVVDRARFGGCPDHADSDLITRPGASAA